MAKKNKKPKTSTRERYRQERAVLYFQKKVGNTPLVLFAGAIIAFVFARLQGGGGPLYYVVAAMLAGIGVWQFIYARDAGVDPKEVDETMKRRFTGSELTERALNASKLEYEDFLSAQKRSIFGYSLKSLHGNEPLLRGESAEGPGRSSNLEFSCFTFAPEHLECYSLVCSFLEEGKEDSFRVWPYEEIQKAAIETCEAGCAGHPEGSLSLQRPFKQLVITDLQGTRSCYALWDSCDADARSILRMIQKKKGTKDTCEA